jgi:hypothetical protein
LLQRKLSACVRDPDTDKTSRLKHWGWIPDRWYEADSEIPPGRIPDYLIEYGVESPDRPFDDVVVGPPGSIIRGISRPVFLFRKEFDKWFERVFGNLKRIGRPRGSGAYNDEAHVRKMRELITSGKGKSSEDAALKVAPEAEGATPLSIQRRLGRKYRKQFPE